MTGTAAGTMTLSADVTVSVYIFFDGELETDSVCVKGTLDSGKINIVNIGIPGTSSRCFFLTPDQN